MNEQESKTGRGWAIASMVVLIMDIIGLIVLVLMTLGTKAKFGKIFTELLDCRSLPTVTMLFISIPSAVYLLLFAGLIIALTVKEKYILNIPLKFAVNMFVFVGGLAYLSVYVIAMFLPLLQIIQEKEATKAEESQVISSKESDVEKVKELAEKDPEAAAKWAIQLPKVGARNMAMGQVAECWANKDPKSAAKWVMGLPEKYNTYLIADVAGRWAYNDPDAAIEWVMQLPKGNTPIIIEGALYTKDISRNRAICKVADNWAYKFPEAAAKWAMQLPKGEARDGAIGNVAYRWAWVDQSKSPGAAVEWVMKLPEGDARNKAIANVARGWAVNDPEKAMNWATGLPEGEARNEAIRCAASIWVKKSPETAAKWALQQPDGRTRDKAIDEVFREWRGKNFETAINWANELPKGKDRDQALQGIKEAN